MKKVLVHFAVDRNGGEFRRIARLCKDFDETHDCITHEVVFLPVFSVNETINNNLGESLNVYKVLLPLRRYSFIRKINRLLIRILVRFIVNKYKPDILWGETLNGYSAIRKIVGLRKYVDIHGAAPEEAQYFSDNPKLFSELNAIEEDVIHGADKIILQSVSMKVHLMTKYPFCRFDDKISIYNCGVDTNLFDYHKINIPVIRMDHSILPDDIVFVYTGGIQKWQLVFESLDIYKQIHSSIPNTKYIMLIQGDRFVVDKYCSDNDIKDVQIYQNVLFSDVFAYLSISDFAWLLRENIILNKVASPTKLGEYLACGQVLITTEVAQNWPWIKNNLNDIIMVDLNDIFASARKVVSFIKSNNLSVQKKDAFRQMAIDNLSSDMDRLTISRC